MEQINKQKKEYLKKVIQNNDNLASRAVNWTVNYNKKADMIVVGQSFSVDSAYVAVDAEGVLLRIGSDKKIYGFAIENTKKFMQANPQLANTFMPYVYPFRYKISLPFKFVAFFVVYQSVHGFNNMKKNLETTINSVIGETFCFR